MKKAIPKLLIFFYLIPLLISIAFATLGALFTEMYLDFRDIPEWVSVLTPAVKDIAAFFAIYASFGIAAYYIFYEKGWKGFVFTAASAVFTALVFVCHYLIYHIMAANTLYDINMYEIYHDNVSYAFTETTNFAIFLCFVLIIRATYGLFLMKEPPNPKYTFSPKHPIGLSAIIFTAVSIIMAVLIAFLIFLLPQALCVWLNAPDCIFLYLLVIPFLLGYAHFAIDCLDY